MKHDIHDLLPVLFAGTVYGYQYFCEQTGLQYKDVERVNSFDQLKGYENKMLFYGYNYAWINADKDIFEYTITHGIHLISWPNSPFCLTFMNKVMTEYKPDELA